MPARWWKVIGKPPPPWAVPVLMRPLLYVHSTHEAGATLSSVAREKTKAKGQGDTTCLKPVKANKNQELVEPGFELRNP